MIEIRAYNGTRHYVSPAAIASVSETGASSQWHGIRSIVRLFDGAVIESDDRAETISAAVARHGHRRGWGNRPSRPQRIR